VQEAWAIRVEVLVFSINEFRLLPSGCPDRAVVQ
jgi:hypothetical protein